MSDDGYPRFVGRTTDDGLMDLYAAILARRSVRRYDRRALDGETLARVREIGVYCEIHPYDMDEQALRVFHPHGVILSGGPETVTGGDAPKAPQRVFELGVPVLGICYGMQTMAAQLGGRVENADRHEYGYAQVRARGHSRLLSDIEDHTSPEGYGLLDVWMSHGDRVIELPGGFKLMASTDAAPIAGMADDERGYYGVQFHPEVTHTHQGGRILRRFVLEICGCEALWTPGNIIEESIHQVREQIGDEEVLLGLSGGVDSSVVAALLHKAIGEQLTCVFVDTGLLRHREGDQVMATFAEHMGVKVIRVDAEARFLAKLEGLIDPEDKRKAIGEQLTCVFVDNGLLRLHEGDQVMATFAEHMGVNVVRVNAEDRFEGYAVERTELLAFIDGNGIDYGVSVQAERVVLSADALSAKAEVVFGLLADLVTLLVIAGPTRRFTDTEIDLLSAYLERNGRLVALLDPLTYTGLEEVLEDPLGDVGFEGPLGVGVRAVAAVCALLFLPLREAFMANWAFNGVILGVLVTGILIR